MMSHNPRMYLLLFVFGLALTASPVRAVSNAGDLRAATQNPISSMYSLPFKFTFDNGADNGDANFLNIQPVLPATVGDWNLVSRIIIPVATASGSVRLNVLTPPLRFKKMQ